MCGFRFDHREIRREAIRYAHGKGLEVERVESVDAEDGTVYLSVLEGGYDPARMVVRFADGVDTPTGYYT